MTGKPQSYVKHFHDLWMFQSSLTCSNEANYFRDNNESQSNEFFSMKRLTSHLLGLILRQLGTLPVVYREKSQSKHILTASCTIMDHIGHCSLEQ